MVNRIRSILSYIKYRIYIKRVKSFNFEDKDVVLFFMHPHHEIVSGGILSIYFLIEASKKILKEAIVLPVTIEKKAGYTKFKWFDNDLNIYNIYYLQGNLKNSRNIIVHVPECLFVLFIELLKKYNLLSVAKEMKVNILNQNELMLPSSGVFLENKSMFKSMTMTLGFEANKSSHYPYLDYPPVFISNWFYKYTVDFVNYEDKENICIISSDDHVIKNKIIEKIERVLKIQCVEIRNMSFYDFQNLQKKAKWSITFGEGFDNYFSGAYVKSGIGFGVYNKAFFPPVFKENSLPITVFRSYEEMSEKIIDVIKFLDDKKRYHETSNKIKAYVIDHSSPEFVEKELSFHYSNLLNRKIK